jgi:hypothetical protein
MAAPWDDAQVGDEVSVESHRLRGSRRTGTIVETMGSPGHPYFRVRWSDGRETVLHPGPDAVLAPAMPRPTRAAELAAPPPPPSSPRAAPPPAEPERPKPPELRASPGDRLVIRGHHLGEPDRDGEILEVLGEDGRPPFRVRWSETGRVALLFPGADASVEHYPRRRRRVATAKA